MNASRTHRRFDRAARLQQAELENRTATLTALLEPVLLLAMGGKIRGFADAGYIGRRAWTLPATIDVSTPLEVAHDYRTVLTEILEKQFLMSAAAARGVFYDQATAPYLGVVR